MFEKAPATPPSPSAALLRIEGLAVRAPGGAEILREVALRVDAGEAVVLVGPSGSGKSTLLRALFERDAMREEGFGVELADAHAAGSVGLVPQRGAVFDHLDVAGNVALALRYADQPAGAGAAGDDAVRAWLRAVDLDEGWVEHPRAASRLSGGQAQRLAVARVLASGRRVLFLDEPSVGLDPLRVRALAWQLRRVCDANRAGVVVVTHDAAFAAAFADRVLVLQAGRLAPLPLAPRTQPGCRRGPELAAARDALEEALLTVLASTPAAGEGAPDAAEAGAPPPRAPGAGAPRAPIGRPFAVLAQAPAALFAQLARRPRDFFHVLGYVLRQSLLRPLVFYALVSALLGFTVLYVLGSVGGELGRAASIRVVRGLYVLALTPPLSAFLFVAASSNAVNAWLGGMRLSKQVTALEALGIPRARYLWGPAWGGLVLAYLLVAVVFAAGLLGGGLLLCALQGVPDAWALLTSDVIDPVPERAPYLWRACGLVVLYAAGCAADAVARADAPKEQADDVTRAMTRSVVACTLWVAALELGSLVLVRLALARA